MARHAHPNSGSQDWDIRKEDEREDDIDKVGETADGNKEGEEPLAEDDAAMLDGNPSDGANNGEQPVVNEGAETSKVGGSPDDELVDEATDDASSADDADEEAEGGEDESDDADGIAANIADDEGDDEGEFAAVRSSGMRPASARSVRSRGHHVQQEIQIEALGISARVFALLAAIAIVAAVVASIVVCLIMQSAAQSSLEYQQRTFEERLTQQFEEEKESLSRIYGLAGKAAKEDANKPVDDATADEGQNQTAEGDAAGQ